MKIAIPTNDRKTIAKRSGRAEEFAVFGLDSNGNIIGIEYRENEHAHHHHEEDDTHHHFGHRHQGNRQGKHLHHEHHGPHRHDEVVNVLGDIDIFLYKAVGKYMRKDLEEAKFNMVRAKGENLKEIIENYYRTLEK